MAIAIYERCTQDFSVVKTQGSSTSFSFSYHWKIPENLFKCYFFTARVDFRVASNPIKNCCLFKKHYINATTFKIIQLDARKGVLGKLAIPTGKAPRLNFSVPECFSKELEYSWKGFAISNFLNFNMTCSILLNVRLKVGSIGFSGSIPPKFEHKLPITKIWKKFPPQLH